MLSWKNSGPAAALLLLLTACGTSPSEQSRQPAVKPTTDSTNSSSETVAPTEAPTDVQSGFVRVDAGEGQSVVACSYSINGKKAEGKSQAECDQLKKDFEKSAGAGSVPVPPVASTPAAPGNTQVACAFNINGKLYEGKSQAECDKLKKDLGITVNVPSIPAPTQTPAPAQGSTPATNVACAFNINGTLYEGKSQAECDKLKKDLGLQF